MASKGAAGAVKTETRRQKSEREQAFFAEPETLDSLIEWIAGRGTLDKWCKAHNLRYMPTHEWLYGNPDRLSRYTKALEGRQSSLQDLVIDGMRESAEADVTGLYDEDGKPVEPHKLPDSLRRVVSKVKVVEKTIKVGDDDVGLEKTIEYQLDPRGAAREQLGKHLGMFKEQVQLSGEVKVTEDPEQTARRVAFLLAQGVQSKTSPNRKGGGA